MYINIGDKTANQDCAGKARGEEARDARYGGACRELGDGIWIFTRETDIDLDGIAIGEATHVAFGKQAIGEEGEKDKLGQSQ